MATITAQQRTADGTEAGEDGVTNNRTTAGA